ncbi:MAG: uracil-DNA glycosylase family protein [Bacteroidaceae bacterium]|nr:uracil-DNA glycosylase family protein [Bacteroidaceae bacterium]
MACTTEGVEYHPLHPFLPEGCRVLFLGSFPPQRKRWCMDFFYPNFINDHWRIEGLIFFGDKDYFVDTKAKTFRLDRIIPFLEQKGIGFYDTATAVRRLRDNASDKFLEVVEPTDIRALLRRVPQCRVIVTTGEKATHTLCQTLNIHNMPSVGKYEPIPELCSCGEQMFLYRLPSSSRAYPMSLPQKADAYRQMFQFCGVE